MNTTEQHARKAQTILGPVPADELGITLPHEHLIVDAGILFAEPEQAEMKERAYEPVNITNISWIQYNQYNNRDNVCLLSEETAVEEAMQFKDEGGGTIVDVTTTGLGRDLEALQRISRATGLHVIAGAGYYVLSEGDRAMLERKTEDDLAAEIVADIREGADGTDICCGIIGEIGCSWPLQEWEQKLLRASAGAQEQTGAPITIHPGRHEDSPMQILRILNEAGADLDRVVMGHIDRTGFRSDTLLEMARTGCYLEYDIFGGNPFYPLRFGVFDRPCDRERIEQIGSLVEAGYLNRILISQDTCLKSKLVRYGGQGYAHILRNILPQMRVRGFTEEQIKTIMVDNPAKLLCFV